MTHIKSNYGSTLGLPGGPTIAPGSTVVVERWHFIKNAFVVKAWLQAGVIEEIGEMAKEPVAPVAPVTPEVPIEPVTPVDPVVPTPDQPKSAAELLAMIEGGTHFKTVQAEAKKLLGDGAPSKKDELITALEERATQPD